MTTFSKKERVIAAILSATPGLKAFLKGVYISINAKLHKKDNIIRVMEEPVNIKLIDSLTNYDAESETFGGYYDIATVNNKGKVLSHLSSVASVNLPSDTVPVEILITDLFHSTKYKNETRCDLHPRFSTSGEYISFDTVYQGKRRKQVIDIKSILSL